MKGESGKTARVIVDTYWNPQSGDTSGNSLRFEVDGEAEDETYVPHKFDDGKTQLLVVSNVPVPGMIVLSCAPSEDVVPVAYLVVQNPFGDDEDVDFSTKNLGNGSLTIKMKRHTTQ